MQKALVKSLLPGSQWSRRDCILRSKRLQGQSETKKQWSKEELELEIMKLTIIAESDA